MEECYEPRTSSQSTIQPSSMENDENVDEEEGDDTTRTPPPSLTMTTTIPTCCSATSDTAATLEPHTPIASLPTAQTSSSQDDAAAATTKNSNDFKLAIAFVSMVLVATGVSVMGKLVVRRFLSFTIIIIILGFFVSNLATCNAARNQTKQTKTRQFPCTIIPIF
eukprot:scaffold913_cov71-Cylindrotheca_fusiformis.AAC.2